MITIATIKKLFIKIIRYIKNTVLRITRVKTIGVRALVFNDLNQILLIHHTYLPGWYLPGGTLKYAEIPQDAVIREVFEETGINISVGNCKHLHQQDDKHKHKHLDSGYTARDHIISRGSPDLADSKSKTQLSLFAVYLNKCEKRTDYPIVYVAQVMDQIVNINDHAEIADAAWFDLNQLPDQTTNATRARIQEYFQQKNFTGIW